MNEFFSTVGLYALRADIIANIAFGLVLALICLPIMLALKKRLIPDVMSGKQFGALVLISSALEILLTHFVADHVNYILADLTNGSAARFAVFAVVAAAVSALVSVAQAFIIGSDDNKVTTVLVLQSAVVVVLTLLKELIENGVVDYLALH